MSRNLKQPQVKKYAKSAITIKSVDIHFLKSKTWRNLAALLVKRIFDVFKSNIPGRGKEQLDPEIMKYIKDRAFELYECSQSDIKEEWAKCVVYLLIKNPKLEETSQ